MNMKSKFGKIRSVLEISKLWADCRSKDPSSKVGAAVFNPITGSIHLGYNGFPSGYPDSKLHWNNRDPKTGITKYELVIHAEVNAIRKAWQAGEDTSQCVLVCSHVPCQNCMRDVVATSGIKKIYYETFDYPSNNERANNVRSRIAEELGISIEQIKGEGDE